jgi:hypothetical protein
LLFHKRLILQCHKTVIIGVYSDSQLYKTIGYYKMKRSLKNNQRRKQLTRQHHKVVSRRQSHFNQVINEQLDSQTPSQLCQ